MKECTRCKETKSLDEFHNCKSKKSGKMSHCKVCRNSYNAKKAKEIGHDVLYRRALDRNPEAYKKKAKEYYEKNKQTAIDRVAQWRKENPGCRSIEYQKAREKKIAYAAEWAKSNPERRRAIASNYSKRFRDNPENRPVIICRKLIARVMMLSESGRKGRTEKCLGYTRHEFKRSMESKFKKGMTWDNHGDWHVDHIKPVSLFVSEGVTDPKVINALDNLQPLWAKDNLSKGAKYES